MNTLTQQQQVNQYQWQVADGVATPVNPHVGYVFAEEDKGYIFEQNQLFEKFDEFAKQHQFQTNAPDGIYSGEAFEEPVWQYYDGEVWWDEPNDEERKLSQLTGLDTRLFLRLKPSHLPAVLTTQAGEEWKDRYNSIWQIQLHDGTWTDAHVNENSRKISFIEWQDGSEFKREIYRLITSPAEQETKSVEHLPTVEELLSRYYKKEYWGNYDVFDYYDEDTVSEMVSVALNFSSQLQSTLTQKDQRISELEQMLDQCQKNDLYFEQEKEQLNNRVAELGIKWISITIKEPELDSTIMIADLIMGGVAIMDYDEREQLQYFKYWMPLPTPPQH